MLKKVLLISSGQPSLNPRLVKEADALTDAGYNVTVLYSYWNKWGTDFDKQLLPTKKWKAICVAGDPEQKTTTYFISRIIYKLTRTINYNTNGRLMANLAAARASYFLIREAKKHKADIYIGHNFGALPATVMAAKANGKPCGFDAEDFHRNETSDDGTNPDVVLKTNIENKYLPQLNYFTTSSPQIADAYTQLYPLLKPVVLLNVFNHCVTTTKSKPQSGPLRLLWFSQTIGANRGLQDAVKAIQLLNRQHFELHILGSTIHSPKDFINELKNSRIIITFHEPVNPNELTTFAAQFDIGLAPEPGFSFNNNIALSNKIFTYMQAGLAVIASNTAAQQYLIDTNPGMGMIYKKGDAQGLAALLERLNNDRELLAATQTESLRLARVSYNWEAESLKLLEVVKQTLNGQ